MATKSLTHESFYPTWSDAEGPDGCFSVRQSHVLIDHASRDAFVDHGVINCRLIKRVNSLAAATETETRRRLIVFDINSLRTTSKRCTGVGHGRRGTDVRLADVSSPVTSVERDVPRRARLHDARRRRSVFYNGSTLEHVIIITIVTAHPEGHVRLVVQTRLTFSVKGAFI